MRALSFAADLHVAMGNAKRYHRNPANAKQLASLSSNCPFALLLVTVSRREVVGK